MTETIITRRCTKCKQIKPSFEFHKDYTRKDGFRYICKTCQKIYDSNYLQTEKGAVVNRKHVRKFYKTEKGKANNKRYRIQHPERFKARDAVSCAIKTGKLLHPDTFQCSCGVQAQEYHHPSYEPNHQLDVVPICFECHNRIHRKLA